MSVKKAILIFFISVSQFLTGQYNLNGSYEYKTYFTGAGYGKFYKYDFNNDGIEDILLVGKNDKQVIWFKLNAKGNLDETINKFFFYPVSNIQKFKNIAGTDTHLFTSRKKRMLGLVSFTKYGTLQLLNEIRFDSYPSEIVSGDFNCDGVLDALTFGNSFEGISLVEEKGYKLSSLKIIEKGAFSTLAPVDFNTDGKSDFIAFNFLDHSLYFFENSDSAVFNNIRKIKLDSEIDKLSACSFNEDQYTDLVFSTENNIGIFYGDSVFSYSVRKKITIENKVLDFTVCDLNNDKKNDIAVLTESGIYFVYNSSADTLEKPLQFDYMENITTITNIGSNIYYYSKDGRISSSKHFGFFKPEIKIKYSPQAKCLNTFYINGIYYLTFVDSVKSELILVGDFLSSNSRFLHISIQNTLVQKVVAIQNHNIIDFCLINKNQDFMEIVSLDTQTGKLEKNNALLDGDLITCFTSEQNNRLVLVSRKDSLLNYSEIDFNSNELITIIKSVVIPDSSDILVTSEKFFLPEINDGRFQLKEMESENIIKNFSADSSIQYENISEGIAFVFSKGKMLFITNNKIAEIKFDIENFDKNKLKVVNKTKFAYLDSDNKRIFLIELAEKETKVYSFDIRLEDNFNLHDFQVMETLLIFTAEDGTINIQELK